MSLRDILNDAIDDQRADQVRKQAHNLLLEVTEGDADAITHAVQAMGSGCILDDLKGRGQLEGAVILLQWIRNFQQHR